MFLLKTTGVAFYHETMLPQEKAVVEKLFKAGAIQIVVASKDTCWGMTMAASTVVLMGTQYFEGKEHRYVDYPIADVLQMMGRASRPTIDTEGNCYIMCQATKRVPIIPPQII